MRGRCIIAKRGIAFFFLVAGVCLFAEDKQGWIYVLNSEDNAITILDTKTKDFEASIPLSGRNPVGLFPAPSGKYVFVLNRDSRSISIIDSEVHEVIKTLDVGSFDPETITFSPMGEWVYITHHGSSEITVFSHKKLVLERSDQFLLGNPGTPLVFNRRGTRYYRSIQEGLGVGYIKTNEIIKSFVFSGGSMAWTFSPDFRYLWGAALNGKTVVVIDEKKARVAKTINVEVKPATPVFSSDGRKVYLIAKDGKKVTEINGRSFKQSGEIPFPASVDELVYDDDGVLWARSTSEGAVFWVDIKSSGTPESIDIPGNPDQIVYVKLKDGEGFACY